MTQQTSPWIEGAYGWGFGESGWNSGMDSNLLKFSFMFDRNVDSIVASLPAAVNGQAHYLTTDNRLYFAIGTTYLSTPVPKWFTIVVRDTGQTHQFNGTSLVQVNTDSQVDSRLDAIEITISSLGTAAFEDVGVFATQAELDVLEAQQQAYTDALRDDLADNTDPLQGAALIGRGAIIVASVLDLQLSGQQTDQAVYMSAFAPGVFSLANPYASGLGGGFFKWSPSVPRSAHDGGRVISPTVPLSGDLSNLVAFLAGTGETSPAGFGCWVRITDGDANASWYGADPTGVRDSKASIQAAHDACFAENVNRVGGYVIEEGVYRLNSQLAISPIAQLTCQGNVILQSYAASGSAIWISTAFGNWSNPAVRSDRHMQKTIDGKCLLQNMSGGATTGIFFGKEDAVLDQSAESITIDGLSMLGWPIEFDFGTSSYLTSFRNGFSKQAGTSIYINEGANFVDRLERMSFDNWTWSLCTNVIDGDANYGGEFNFNNCSFDFCERVISNVANTAILNFVTPHFEWDGETTYLAANGAVNLVSPYFINTGFVGPAAIPLAASVGANGVLNIVNPTYNTATGVTMYALGAASSRISISGESRSFGGVMAQLVENSAGGIVSSGALDKAGTLPTTAMAANAITTINVLFPVPFIDECTYAHAIGQPDGSADFFGCVFITNRTKTGFTANFKNGAAAQNLLNIAWEAKGR